VAPAIEGRARREVAVSPVIVRRASVLGLVLALGAAGVAVADTVTADGDAITAGSQTSVNLGDVAPGATRSVDVDFVLACKGSSHVDANATIAVLATSQSNPDDGTATVTPAQIEVPADWPAPGEACTGGGPVTSSTAAHVVVTAPSTVGPGRTYDLLFGFDPDTGGITNTTALTITLDVVEPSPPPPPAEPPSEPPAPPAPDPDPDPATTLVGAWGRPLDTDAVPAMVGRLGRTIPLKLRLTDGEQRLGPASVSAPNLALEQLAACAADASVLDTRSAGTFRWEGRRWHLNLRTKGLTPGCWRLVATVDGAPVADAVVQLVRHATPAAANRRR
jgi:hypothetical protein